MEAWREELYHHGILGQKWGVRRYQNYDGTYTKKGLENYKNSVEKYQIANGIRKASEKYVREGPGKTLDRKGKKIIVKEAKKEEKAAKAAMKKNYKQLKQDYKADHGKDLYARGVRITSNEENAVIREAAVGIASVAARKLLEKKGDVYVKGVGTMAVNDLAATSIAVGGTFINGVLTVRDKIRNSQLRAYYGHSAKYAD